MDRRPQLQEFASRELQTYAAFAEVDERDLYWGTSEHCGHILALHFRPTGIAFNNRSERVVDIAERGRTHDIRFSLEVCTEGEGAGGIEVRAHQKLKEDGPVSRMSLLTDDWEEMDFGEEMGSVGWLPRELAPLLRPLMHTAPYCISSYSVAPAGMYPSRRTRHPTMYLCLLIWRLTDEDEDLARGMRSDYDTVFNRTNLRIWDNTSLQPAWVMLPGIASDLDFA